MRPICCSEPSTVLIYTCLFLLVNYAYFCYLRASLAVFISSDIVLIGFSKLIGKYFEQILLRIERGSKFSFLFLRITPFPRDELNIHYLGAP
jgi:hypothetical protein